MVHIRLRRSPGPRRTQYGFAGAYFRSDAKERRPEVLITAVVHCVRSGDKRTICRCGVGAAEIDLKYLLSLYVLA